MTQLNTTPLTPDRQSLLTNYDPCQVVITPNVAVPVWTWTGSVAVNNTYIPSFTFTSILLTTNNQ